MSDNAAVGLIKALVESLSVSSEDWEALALVLKFDGKRVNAVHGFSYLPDGKTAGATASPTDIRPAVEEYTASYYKPDEPLPVAILVQFDRPSGQYEITFEDTDRMRWKVTPANFSSIREDLRPVFD